MSLYKFIGKRIVSLKYDFSNYLNSKRENRFSILQPIIYLRDLYGKLNMFFFRKRGHKFYFEKHNFIYFNIEKVAQSTIFSKLEKEGIKLREIKSWKKHLFKDSYKFAFVRNPYDRLVSCYENKVNNPPPKESFRGVFLGFYKYGKMHSKMSFEEFTRAVCKIPDSISDPHIRSQSEFICDKKGKKLVNDIFRFENLKKDLKEVSKKIGIDISSDSIHENKTSRKKYQEYYTPELIRLVGKRYARDLKNFNYSF